VLPLPPNRRAAGRRLAEALLDPLARGVRAVTGRGRAELDEELAAELEPQAVEAAEAAEEPEAAEAAQPEAAAVAAAAVQSGAAAAAAAALGDVEEAAAAPSDADDMAARIDEARARLRARIAPPADDDATDSAHDPAARLRGEDPAPPTQATPPS
jgi:hypothetical protein